MASGKRASMREGPLADLFRKTEQAGRAGRRAAAPPPAPRRAPASPRPPRRPRQERRAPEPPPPHPRETGYPHPSLRRDADAPPTPEPRVPTPQERLRHAFSADIPDNILEPPAPRPARRRARSVRRASPTSRRRGARAKPVGQPVLRVVGVGGAGVNAVNRMVEAQVEGVEFIADQHRPAVAAAVDGRHHAAHRPADHPRAGRRLEPRSRPRSRDGGVRPHQGAAQGLGHGLHRRRRRRRHGHRRGADRRAHRPRARRADRRHRHQAVRLRGQPPRGGGRRRHRRRWPTRSTRSSSCRTTGC